MKKQNILLQDGFMGGKVVYAKDVHKVFTYVETNNDN